MRMKLEVEGVETIVAALRDMRHDLARRHLAAAVRAGAEVIREEAQRRAPVDTGALRDDIKTRRVMNPVDAPVEYRVANSKETFYARFVEFGHAKVKPGQYREYRATLRAKREWAGGYVAPRPFMRPAFDTKRDEAQRVIARELKRRLKLK